MIDTQQNNSHMCCKQLPQPPTNESKARRIGDSCQVLLLCQSYRDVDD